MGEAALLNLRLQRSDLQRATDLISSGDRPAGHWGLAQLRGRLTELVGGSRSANVSLAVRLILQAQTEGEFAAWVATHRDVFFPPDVAAAGVDLAALPVIWALPAQPDGGLRRGTSESGRRGAPNPRNASGAGRPNGKRGEHGAGRPAREAVRAAERLLRSGAFGLVVIDLARDLHLESAAQGRLLRLAEEHDAQVLVLRRKRKDGRYSGSLVTVRAESSSEQVAPGTFRATLTNTKDKREGPGWTMSEEFDGPSGLY